MSWNVICTINQLRSNNSQHMLPRVLAEWGCKQIIPLSTWYFSAFVNRLYADLIDPIITYPFPSCSWHLTWLLLTILGCRPLVRWLDVFNMQYVLSSLSKYVRPSFRANQAQVSGGSPCLCACSPNRPHLRRHRSRSTSLNSTSSSLETPVKHKFRNFHKDTDFSSFPSHRDSSRGIYIVFPPHLCHTGTLPFCVFPHCNSRDFFCTFKRNSELSHAHGHR